MATLAPWIIFIVFVLLMLALDLGVFHRDSHEVKFKEAILWSGIWVSLALCFAVILYYWEGPGPALSFLTGFVIEKSLSVDNLFIFLMIFSYFKVPPRYQHKILFWGIIGALVMRAIFIFAGVALIERFHFVIYIFGGFLIVTGLKMAFEEEKEFDPNKNPILKLVRKFLPVTTQDHQGHFTVKIDHKLYFTPLFITLVFVEISDLIFAVDSIPAILAISTDTFIVFTSNVFAILGLRSLYFALAGFNEMFKYLKYGLAIILIFIGIKMSISHFFKIPIGVALGFVFFILLVSVLVSIYETYTEKKKA